MRSAAKSFMDEVNLVTGYTGNPLKIQVSLSFKLGTASASAFGRKIGQVI